MRSPHIPSLDVHQDGHHFDEKPTSHLILSCIEQDYKGFEENYLSFGEKPYVAIQYIIMPVQNRKGKSHENQIEFVSEHKSCFSVWAPSVLHLPSKTIVNTMTANTAT